MRDCEAPDTETFRLCYRLLFENARDGVLLIDASSQEIVEANPAVHQLLMLRENDLQGRQLFNAGIFRNPAIIRQAIEETRNVGPITIDDTEVKGGVGFDIIVNIVAHILYVGGRGFIHLKMRDITKLKELERAGESRRLQLELSNRELNAFAHIASHDLQEPLRAIQAFGERLDTKYADALDDVGRDYLKRMRDSATRMRMLIHDLAAYASVTPGKRRAKHVSLNETLNAVVNDLEAAIQETGASIGVGKLPVVCGDAAQLRQLFQNILANSIKFRQPEITPVIQVYAGEVDPESTQALASIVVEDNGIGFDQKYADRVFAPFQRLHSQRKYAGTGIGLAICKRIVDLSRGEIAAKSEPGAGTKIYISLPILEAEASQT